MAQAPRLGEHMTLLLDATTKVKGRVVKVQPDGTYRFKWYEASTGGGPLKAWYVGRAPASRLSRKKTRWNKAWGEYLCEKAGLLGGVEEVGRLRSGVRWLDRDSDWSVLSAPRRPAPPRPRLSTSDTRTHLPPLSLPALPALSPRLRLLAGLVPPQDHAPGAPCSRRSAVGLAGRAVPHPRLPVVGWS